MQIGRERLCKGWIKAFGINWMVEPKKIVEPDKPAYKRRFEIGIDWMNIRNIKAGIITEVR